MIFVSSLDGVTYTVAVLVFFSHNTYFFRVWGWGAVCNVTLDGRQLMSTSPGHPYGQIKSLELRESQICWYRFLPPAGARVEVQVYRLIDTGHLNHTRCATKKEQHYRGWLG